MLRAHLNIFLCGIKMIAAIQAWLQFLIINYKTAIIHSISQKNEPKEKVAKTRKNCINPRKTGKSEQICGKYPVILQIATRVAIRNAEIISISAIWPANFPNKLLTNPSSLTDKRSQKFPHAGCR